MLTYTEYGEGTPIIFIHGLGSKKEAWTSQRFLARKYRVITPDLRGHGETKTEDDISVKNFAKDILELMDYLELSSAVVCGLSLGGIIAQELYKQAPSRIQKLVLANTTSYINPFFMPSVLRETEEHYRDEGFGDFIAKGSIHNQKYFNVAKNCFLIRDCYMDCCKAPIGINYFPTLLTIDIPVLLIGASKDKVTPPLHQLLMSFFIRDVERVVLDDCGHLSNIEKASEFNSLIDNFIQG